MAKICDEQCFRKSAKIEKTKICNPFKHKLIICNVSSTEV